MSALTYFVVATAFCIACFLLGYHVRDCAEQEEQQQAPICHKKSYELKAERYFGSENS